MQKITILTITKGKEGDSEKNGKAFHWTSYNLTFPELSIFEQDGTPHKFTKAGTFDAIAADLKAGDTIEAECEINDKGYLGLKKISKVVSPIDPDKKGNPELPHVGKDPPRSGQEIGMWWKELGDMIRSGRACNDFEIAYWVQMELVLGLRKSPDQPNTPKPAEKSTVTPVEGKTRDCGVDMEWLRETCKKIKWNDAVCESWVEASFKVKRAETLEKTIALLDKGQKEKLCDFVAKAAAGK